MFEHFEEKKHNKIITFYFDKNNENNEKWEDIFKKEIMELKNVKENLINYKNFYMKKKKEI